MFRERQYGNTLNHYAKAVTKSNRSRTKATAFFLARHHNRKRYQSGLTTDFIGHNLFIYDETDTTNNRAKESNSSPDGSVFIAEVQTHGKGSRGRGWTSPRGIGIWHSILLKPEISPLEVSQITLVAGLAVCKAIGLNSMIKWPNDIVINGKKSAVF